MNWLFVVLKLPLSDYFWPIRYDLRRLAPQLEPITRKDDITLFPGSDSLIWQQKFLGIEHRNRLKQPYFFVSKLRVHLSSSFGALSCLQASIADNQFHQIFYRLPPPNFTALITLGLSGASQFGDLTPKIFRRDFLPVLALFPYSYPRGPFSAWRNFWLAPLTHKAYTMLWHFYHYSLPIHQQLYQPLPTNI